MSSHTMLATIPVGEPDIGSEVEALITFTYTKGSSDYWNRSAGLWEQGWGPEIGFVKAEHYCNGKPAPYSGAFADLEQKNLNDVAGSWLEEGDGYYQACKEAEDDCP